MKEQLITRDARGFIVKIVERELTDEAATEAAILEAGRALADRLVARDDLAARCSEALQPLEITLPSGGIDNGLRRRLVDVVATEKLLGRFPYGIRIKFQ
jgi:hypothetical protein